MDCCELTLIGAATRQSAGWSTIFVPALWRLSAFVQTLEQPPRLFLFATLRTNEVRGSKRISARELTVTAGPVQNGSPQHGELTAVASYSLAQLRMFPGASS